MFALIAIGAIAFYSAYQQAKAVTDNELSHIAALMHALLRAEDMEEARHPHINDNDEAENPDIVELGNKFDSIDQGYKEKIAFRIWKERKLLFYSEDANDFGPERLTSGFSNQEIHGKEWRFFVLSDEKSGYTLEVALKSKVRILVINRIMATIFSPLLLLLPIVFFLTLFGLRTGLKPLLDVSQAVKNRSAFDLAPPVDRRVASRN